MPEIEPRDGVDFLMCLVLMAPVLCTWVFLILWYGRLESFEHVEALERARIRDSGRSPDNGGRGDENYVGLGDVKAEKP